QRLKCPVIVGLQLGDSQPFQPVGYLKDGLSAVPEELRDTAIANLTVERDELDKHPLPGGQLLEPLRREDLIANPLIVADENLVVAADWVIVVRRNGVELRGRHHTATIDFCHPCALRGRTTSSPARPRCQHATTTSR